MLIKLGQKKDLDDATVLKKMQELIGLSLEIAITGEELARYCKEARFELMQIREVHIFHKKWKSGMR
ncbi:MAG: hypothetical protein K2I10_13735 [Lachnospiraceae bacterium]|nr:hypothetical protein [Lachnospiraceae bacterium]